VTRYVTSLTNASDVICISDTRLKQFVNLNKLNVSFNRRITNDDLEFLSRLTTLEIYCNLVITSATVQSLTSLTSLAIGFNAVLTNAALTPLVNLTFHQRWNRAFD
jgi:hypothetical protein